MKIAVLISGGVDSSVVLRTLVDEGGHEITAFYLKVWLEEEMAFLGDCPWEDDLRFARAVCEKVGVPLEVVPLQRQYHDRVVSYTIAELRAGRTPSPDIFCNQQIKFGAFHDEIDASFEKIATGHYAQVEERDGKYWLLKGADPVKDQTYFLSHLSQEQLSRCLFPVGGWPKSAVRERARELGLPNMERRDSQGICFLGKIKYNDFVAAHLGEKPGEIRELETERVLGEHRGFWFHTIGQRKGLGLSQGPWFVVRKELENNVVYVSHQDVLRSPDRFEVARVNWITEPPTAAQLQGLQVKVRHSPTVYGCTLTPTSPDAYTVQLDTEDPGMAEGQFGVFYDGDYCLGGGTIVALPAR